MTDFFPGAGRRATVRDLVFFPGNPGIPKKALFRKAPILGAANSRNLKNGIIPPARAPVARPRKRGCAKKTTNLKSCLFRLPAIFGFPPPHPHRCAPKLGCWDHPMGSAHIQHLRGFPGFSRKWRTGPGSGADGEITRPSYPTRYINIG